MTKQQVTSRVALFPGSFDPFTIGHKSILDRALPLFDHVYVVIGYNKAKHGIMSPAERLTTIEQLYASNSKISVVTWDGLMVDLARELGATYMIRGVRTGSDFEYEQTLATINRTISGIETIFIPSLPEHTAISSSVVRELQHFGHDTTQFLPK